MSGGDLGLGRGYSSDRGYPGYVQVMFGKGSKRESSDESPVTQAANQAIMGVGEQLKSFNASNLPPPPTRPAPPPPARPAPPLPTVSAPLFPPGEALPLPPKYSLLSQNSTLNHQENVYKILVGNKLENREMFKAANLLLLDLKQKRPFVRGDVDKKRLEMMISGLEVFLQRCENTFFDPVAFKKTKATASKAKCLRGLEQPFGVKDKKIVVPEWFRDLVSALQNVSKPDQMLEVFQFKTLELMERAIMLQDPEAAQKHLNLIKDPDFLDLAMTIAGISEKVRKRVIGGVDENPLIAQQENHEFLSQVPRHTGRPSKEGVSAVRNSPGGGRISRGSRAVKQGEDKRFLNIRAKNEDAFFMDSKDRLVRIREKLLNLDASIKDDKENGQSSGFSPKTAALAGQAIGSLQQALSVLSRNADSPNHAKVSMQLFLFFKEFAHHVNQAGMYDCWASELEALTQQSGWELKPDSKTLNDLEGFLKPAMQAAFKHSTGEYARATGAVLAIMDHLLMIGDFERLSFFFDGEGVKAVLNAKGEGIRDKVITGTRTNRLDDQTKNVMQSMAYKRIMEEGILRCASQINTVEGILRNITPGNVPLIQIVIARQLDGVKDPKQVEEVLSEFFQKLQEDALQEVKDPAALEQIRKKAFLPPLSPSDEEEVSRREGQLFVQGKQAEWFNKMGETWNHQSPQTLFLIAYLSSPFSIRSILKKAGLYHHNDFNESRVSIDSSTYLRTVAKLLQGPEAMAPKLELKPSLGDEEKGPAYKFLKACEEVKTSEESFYRSILELQENSASDALKQKISNHKIPEKVKNPKKLLGKLSLGDAMHEDLRLMDSLLRVDPELRGPDGPLSDFLASLPEEVEANKINKLLERYQSFEFIDLAVQIMSYVGSYLEGVARRGTFSDLVVEESSGNRLFHYLVQPFQRSLRWKDLMGAILKEAGRGIQRESTSDAFWDSLSRSVYLANALGTLPNAIRPSTPSPGDTSPLKIEDSQS